MISKKAIIGTKVGMTQIFDENGKVIPVTVIKAGPCPVLQVKEVNGAKSYQLGFGETEARKLSRGELGHLCKAHNLDLASVINASKLKNDAGSNTKIIMHTEDGGEDKETEIDLSEIALQKKLHEFKLEGDYSVGDVITATTFEAGDRVDVTGTSKGKGYTGVIKRHGFHRTPESHGGGPVHRHQGSMGSATDSSRVFPGKKMAGHAGVEQVTIMNLDVVKVDSENGLIAIKGAVPGPRGSYVYIRNSVKNA